MSSEWIFKWKIFLFHDIEEDKFMKRYFFDCFELPHSIENKDIVDENGDIDSELEQVNLFLQ